MAKRNYILIKYDNGNVITMLPAGVKVSTVTDGTGSTFSQTKAGNWIADNRTK